jgi:type II secretory pathway pseudopilin PulG
MHNRGLTLLEVLVIIIVIGIVAALILPSFGGDGHCSRMLACQSNLQQLYKLGTVYATMHKGEWPKAHGSDFWIAFSKTTPPLIEPEAREVLTCPLRDDASPGDCHYRGPRIPFSQLDSQDPIVADLEGNHGEGEPINVVLKDGSVFDEAPGDTLWKKCRELLRP